VVALAVFGLFAKFVLDAFPNSGDEVSYVLQAQTYARGRLWVAPPPVAEAFRLYWFLDKGDKWVGYFALGWPMVMTPFFLLGLPLWIVNPLIGAASLPAFFLLARQYVSRQSAWLGMLLLGLSAFFIFNSGSYFSHSVTALYGILFAICGAKYFAKGEWRYALAAGACIGLMGVTRTQNAVIFAAVFAAALFLTSGRRKGFLWFCLGGLPFFVALLIFQYDVTGNALLPVQQWMRPEPIAMPSMSNVLMMEWHLADLSTWTCPLLVLGFGAAFVVLFRTGRLDFVDWIMPVTIVILLAFHDYGGNQYGPRYYFEAWPMAMLTMLKVIDPVLFGGERAQLKPWLASAVMASLVFELAYLPAHTHREHVVVMERQDVYRKVERAGLNNALVIVAGATGKTRPMAPRDLVRNGLDVSNRKVIYVLDQPERQADLLAQYPGRSVYVYSDAQLRSAR
jgi:hypothetical protein